MICSINKLIDDNSMKNKKNFEIPQEYCCKITLVHISI